MKKLIVIFFTCLSLVLNPIMIIANANEEELDKHWARGAIMSMKYAGVIQGYEDGTFRPENQVTRAEFIAMLFRIVCVVDQKKVVDEYDKYNFRRTYNNDRDYELRQRALNDFKGKSFEVSYTDMQNHWAKNYLGWLEEYFNKGQIDVLKRVFSGENFNPGLPITREEAALLSTPFLQVSIEDKELLLSDAVEPYKYSQEIKALVNNGIIQGNDKGLFNPTHTLTRAEAATILLRLLYEVNYRLDYFTEYMQEYRYSWFEGIPTPIFLKLGETSPELFNIGFSYYLDILQNIAGWESGVESRPNYVAPGDRLALLKDLEKNNYHNKAMINFYYYYDMFYNGFISGRLLRESNEDKALRYGYLKKAIEFIPQSNNAPEDLIELYAFAIYEMQDKGMHNIYLKEMLRLADLLPKGDDFIGYMTLQTTKKIDYMAIQNAIALEKYSDAINYIDVALTREEINMDNFFYHGLKAYCQLKLGLGKEKVFNETKKVIEEILLIKTEISGGYLDLVKDFTWLLKTIKRF